MVKPYPKYKESGTPWFGNLPEHWQTPRLGAVLMERKETNKENTPQTDYFYGIGWKVNDNLQIDLMGFSELTKLDNWRLSATLKF